MGGALLSLSLICAHHLRSVSFEFWAAAVFIYMLPVVIPRFYASKSVHIFIHITSRGYSDCPSARVNHTGS